MAATADTTGLVIPHGSWRVDPGRSEVTFSLRHLFVMPVRGRFTEFEGSLAVERDGSAVASGSVRAASVETGDAKRDERLREADFFDAEHCPLIRLYGGTATPLEGSRLRVTGDLEIRGLRQTVELIARPGEIGGERAELTLHGQLSRGAFGIESEQLLDAGISDRVDVVLKLCLVRAD